MRIRTRAYLLGLMPALAVALILGAYLALSRLHDLDANLMERGAGLARHLAQGSEYAVVSGDRAALRAQIEWARRERDVVYVGVFNADGAVLAQAGPPPGGMPLTDRVSLAAVSEQRGVAYFSHAVRLAPLPVDDLFIAARGEHTPRPIAWVRVGVSRAGNTAIIRSTLLTTAGISALGLLFAMVLVRVLALIGIRPLMEMIEAVRGMAAGNFRVRLPITARSELKELQLYINKMSETLQSFQEDMRRRVDEATASLAEQKEAAEQANRAKSRFLAAASHDLRQPMHAIGLYVEAMKPQVAGREAADTLGRIEAAVAAMEGLFCAILDVSKLDAGIIRPVPANVDIRELLGQLHEDFRNEAQEKGLRLRLKCPPAFVVSDPLLLTRILRNLIVNALRYTERGGVLLAGRRWGGNILLQVWDTGRGIPREHLDAVFQEFFQLDNPQRDRAQGMGLGLAIVDRLARLLGHRVTVRSTPGRGTVFALEVPIGQAGAPPLPGMEDDLARMTRLRGRVAVVDDDAMVRDSLVDLLRGWGLEVVAGRDRAELLARLEEAPDVLLTDYRLAEGDGLGVATALYQAFPGSDPRVVVLTGDTSGESVARLNASGYPILHKPVRPAKLRALLARLLRARTGTRPG